METRDGFVEHDGISLNYERFGSGRTVGMIT